jgi:glucose-6-phosphate dehydrogenase assembly protein OpcA
MPTKTVAGDPVELKDVERELARRLKAIEGLGKGPVLRACMSNLVIFCDSPALAERVSAQIPEILSHHPARVLLLAGSAEASAKTTASVSVRGRLTGGGEWVCTEQVTLQAPGNALEDLPFSVRPLLVGDLPTNLWWAPAQPPPLGGSLLFELAEFSQQVIYDSIGWPEPAKGVVATTSWLGQSECGAGRRRVISDLNWRRLKFWRRMLAQAADPASAPGAIESITELRIEHGPHAVIQAWELASWIASRLSWSVQQAKVEPNVEICWKARAPHGMVNLRLVRLSEGPSEVRRVQVKCSIDGKPVVLNCFPQDAYRLAVQPEGIDAALRTMTTQPQPLPELIARQLSDRDYDPVFTESMAVARVLAESVLQ